MASLASINIRFSANLKEFSSEMQNVSREMKRVGSNLQGIGSQLSVGLTLPVLAAGAASIKMASDYEESLNKVNVSFGDSSAAVQNFAKTTLETFGIAEGTALDMAALFGDMATSMGLPQAEAANLSTSLVGLAGDLASFKNIGIEQATTALNGVFTGETESLKLLGIVMTEANLAQFALEKGIQKNIKSFTQAEKVQLRYAYVMEQTKNAQGDFARTSGGSANQMRVLQERFKELGQQFGAIILPAFTKLITAINAALKGFSQLSPGMKNTIVVVAGLAAAIGPLLVGFGTILTLVPSMVAGFAAVKAAFISFTATIAANPFGAIAVAIGLVVGGLYAYSQANKEVTRTKSTLDKINERAADNLLKERVELERLVSVAKDESKSKVEREKAIKSLNKLSPEYLGNLSLETINTDKAKTAIEGYTQALLQKFRVEAAEAELKELANKRLALELGQLKAKEQLLIAEQKLRSNSTTLEREGFEKLKASLQNGNQLISNFYDAEQRLLEGIINGANLATEANKNLNTELAKRPKLEPIQLPTTQTSSSGTIGALEAEIAKLKELRDQAATTTEQIKLIDAAIKSIETQIQILVDPTSLIQADTVIRRVVNSADVLKQRMQLLSEELSVAFTQIAESAFENLAIGFGKALGQMLKGANVVDSLGSFLLTTIGDLMIQLGQAAIQIGITMTAIKQSFKTPAGAIAAGVALIAIGSVIKASIPNDFEKFADGGIVGGSSYYGDKILARVNSGELILNGKQQRNLYNMLEPSAAQSVNLGVNDIVIDGTKLRIILDRTDELNNRKK